MTAKSETLAEWYIKESGGSIRDYHENLRLGQRLGQALFNALTVEDRERLRGSSADPFYTNSADLTPALDFLTRK